MRHTSWFSETALVTTLSPEAAQLVGDIEAAVDQAGDDPYQLSILLMVVLNEAYSQLSSEEIGIIEELTAVAQSSSEYWTENGATALDAMVSLGAPECEGLTWEECTGVFEWETSLPNVMPPRLRTFLLASQSVGPLPGGTPAVQLPVLLAAHGPVGQCSGSWPNFRRLVGMDLLGGLIGLLAGPGGALFGAWAGSVAELVVQTLYVLACLGII